MFLKEVGNMILPPPTVIAILVLTMMLGIDITLFTVLVIIPSIVIVESAIYAIVPSNTTTSTIYSISSITAQTQQQQIPQNVMIAITGGLLIAILWILAFILRYARGQKLPSMIPMPEYAKLLIMMIAIVLSAFTDTRYIFYYTIYYLVIIIVAPLVDLLGTVGASIFLPLSLMLYSVAVNFIIRSLERMKGEVFITSSIASIVMLGLSTATLSISFEVIDMLLSMGEQIPMYTIYIALMLILISIFSLRELREAFLELKPEAIVQLPTILMLMQVIFLLPFGSFNIRKNRKLSNEER